MLTLTQAVGFAHRLSPPVVHRDLKPQNILLQKADGKLQLKVADFGIGGIAAAKEIEGRPASDTAQAASGLTQSAGTCTPLYASPQKRRFGPPDPRDDVYALGVIWFQMLLGDVTKEPPRGGGWKRKFVERGVSRAEVELLERCLEDDHAERPADAQVLADELAAVLRGGAAPAGRADDAPAPPPAPKEDWYYAKDGAQAGPVDFAGLKKLAAEGVVTAGHAVWTARLGDWKEAKHVEGLLPARPATPPPPPSPPGGTSAKLLIRVPADTTKAGGVAGAVKAYAGLLKSMKNGGGGGDFVVKVHANGRYVAEGSIKDGFEVRTNVPVGKASLDFELWKGSAQSDRKTFNLDCDAAGDYDCGSTSCAA